MAEGEALEARRHEVAAWARQRKPGDLLTIIYTSGTTGDPKGAMLTHGNLVSNVERTLELLQILRGDRCLSFLPLSHILERMAGHYSMMRIGASIYYAESIATVGDDLQATKPTLIVSVPRIYEKIYARVREGVASSSILKRFIFHWAMWAGDMSVPYLYEKRNIPLWIRFQLWWSRHLVFHKILAKTGGNIRFAISGGAPLSPKVMAFFWAIGLPITEGYGLTETSPVLSFNRFGEVVPGKVGRPIYDAWDGRPYVKIAPDGEILCQGPNVMKGYWKNPEATAETFDRDGYFCTGDIGELDARGLLKITDRKKEILVTSGGKKVAPQPIEELLKTDKFVTQAVLLGDRRNFISALIIPNFDSLYRWAHQQKITYSSSRDLVARPEVAQMLMERVEMVNQQLSNFERVKKIAVLDHELSLEAGQLTPSLKVKRRVVNEMYATLIESLYAEA
jgi:long-chain acyl-CoA synthetase